MSGNTLNMKANGFESIVLGFTLFTLGGASRLLTASNIPNFILGVIGWYYILKGFISTKGSIQSNLSPNYRLLLKFYLLLCLIMIARGYMVDYKMPWISIQGMINFHIFDKYYVLPYLMPLVCWIPWQCYKFDKFTKYASWVAIASLIIFVIFFRSILASSMAARTGQDFDFSESGVQFRLYAPFAFACLLVAYLTPKMWRRNMLGLLTLILINMIAGRRGSSLTTVVLFMAAIYFWYKNKEHRYGQATGLIYKAFILLLLAGTIYFVLNSYWFDYLFLRGMQDNRSNVDEALMSQMNDWQLIFGKGLNGRYYFPITHIDYWEGWRFGSETGFYNLVLKGGYLLAITYIVLLLIPAYKGMFKSSNMLCKAGGFFILVSVLELYPFGWLEFSIKFLVIWMLVVLCMSPAVRRMSNREIQNQFF